MTLDLDVDLDLDLGPPGPLIFGQVISGAVSVQTQQAQRWYAARDVYLAGPPDQWRTTRVQAGEHAQAVITPDLISQVAETAPRRVPGPVRFTGYHPVSPQAADMWRSAFGYVSDTVLTRPDIECYPLAAASAARMLAATALDVFPNDALTEPTAADRHDGSPATLRRAVAFIDEHAREDITAAEIAASASVTIRAVQLAFRRHLETTPTEYLRRVRLDHAHRELLAGGPQRYSVSAVAYRWGFPSPSRFAAAYRRAYGVPPSQSLRR